MNEEKPSLQSILAPQIQSAVPTSVVHPLHMLDNQADPETKPKIVLQKSIRTYESDMAELLSKGGTSSTTMAIAEQQRKSRSGQTTTRIQPQTFSPSTTINENTAKAKEQVAPININSVRNPISMTSPLEKNLPQQGYIAPTQAYKTLSQQVYEQQIQPQPIQNKIIESPIPIRRDNAEEYEEEQKTPSHAGRKILMVLMSMIFIAGGIAGGYYLYLKSPLALPSVPPPAAIIPSIITPETQKIISINGSKNKILAEKIKNLVLNENTNLSKTSEFIFTETQSSTTIRVTSASFFDSTGYSIPEILTRSLTGNWMFGVYGDGLKGVPFIILKVDFFQNAYAGMLKWESTITNDLSTMLSYSDTNPQTSTSLASPVIKGKFVDKVILNRDIREFVSENNETLLLYSFVDKDTLIITTSEATLKSLIEKLEKQTYMR